MLSKYFDTTKKRDTARWVLAGIAFILIIIELVSIQNAYIQLYELQTQEVLDNEFNIVQGTAILIAPGTELILERGITFSILNILFNVMFLMFLYVGRIKVEGLDP